MTSPIPDNKPPLVDHKRLDTLRELGAPEGNEFIAELAEIFFQDIEMRLKELVSAIADDNAVVMAEVAHTIKGCCNNIGAEAMACAALELERCGRQASVTGAAEFLEQLQDCFIETRRLLLAETGLS